MTLTPLYYAWKFYLACTLKPLEIKKVISIYNEKFYTLSSLLLGTCFFVICIVIYCFTVLTRILYVVVEDRTFTFRIITQSRRPSRFWLHLKYLCSRDDSVLYTPNWSFKLKRMILKFFQLPLFTIYANYNFEICQRISNLCYSFIMHQKLPILRRVLLN